MYGGFYDELMLYDGGNNLGNTLIVVGGVLIAVACPGIGGAILGGVCAGICLCMTKVSNVAE